MGKQSISRIEEHDMIVVDLGWNKFVLGREDGIKLVELLEKAEVYEEKWIDKVDRGADGADHTYHVYPNDKTFTMRLLPTQLYQMAKLAGKPAKG
jgi:hypothetical protein